MNQPRPTATVSRAASDLAAVREAVSKAGRTFSPDARAARGHTDKMLSAEGLKAERERRLSTVRAQHRKVLEGHKATADTAANLLHSLLSRRPALDAAAVARRETHWRRTEALLDAGHALPQVIQRTTDPEALEALRDELPAYLAAHAGPGRQGVGAALDKHYGRANAPTGGTDAILARIDQRISELAAGTDVGAYAAARAALATEVPTVQAQLDGHAGVLDGTVSPVQAALAATYASQGTR